MSERRQINGHTGRPITVIEDQDEERLISTHQYEVLSREEAAGEEEYVTSAHHDPWAMAAGWLRVASMLIGFLLLLAETALAFRLVFALGHANRGNGFVDFIYNVSGPLVRPFEGIAAERSVGGGGLFEPETLIAMIVWAVVAILFIALVWIARAAPHPERESSLIRRERHRRYARKD